MDTSSTVLREVLQKRKNRSIAIILGVKERDIDPELRKVGATEAGNKLRKVVLDQLNDFYDLVLEIMDSLDNGDVALNAEYLRMIGEIHEQLVGTWVGGAAQR